MHLAGFRTRFRERGRPLKLSDFERVLAQADFRQALFKFLVCFAGVVSGLQSSLSTNLVHHCFNVRIHTAHDAQVDQPGVFRQSVAERIDVLAAESGLGADLFQRGAGAHPELAVGCVGVELLGRTRSARAEVQNRLV